MLAVRQEVERLAPAFIRLPNAQATEFGWWSIEETHRFALHGVVELQLKASTLYPTEH